MPYKRPNQGNKKYLPAYGSKKPGNQGAFNTDYGSDFISIPLPNEEEVPRRHWGAEKGFPSLGRILGFLREHIGIEEIILVGLIILLIDESIEDELLLIILVYILLF